MARCARTACMSAALGVTPPADKLPHNSMRSAPPRSAASAASRLSTLISGKHFRLTNEILRGCEVSKRTVPPIPEHSQHGSRVPAPQEEAHLLRGIGPLFPQQGCIRQKPDCADSEETRDDPVPKIKLHQRGFNAQENTKKEFCAYSSNHRRF